MAAGIQGLFRGRHVQDRQACVPGSSIRQLGVRMSSKIALLFILLLFFASAAEGAQNTFARVRIIVGTPAIIGTLHFSDMLKPGLQQLSVIVTDVLNQPMGNATITANITLPNGTIVNASFAEAAEGNHTFLYNFSGNGDYILH